ncbi:hypothetical protein BDD12DRAFT_840892 [Trichophaea hybrida]|nr:hypothetical protein BDD12DRAFT_840892 [Trichophaea hybrida]
MPGTDGKARAETPRFKTCSTHSFALFSLLFPQIYVPIANRVYILKYSNFTLVFQIFVSFASSLGWAWQVRPTYVLKTSKIDVPLEPLLALDYLASLYSTYLRGGSIKPVMPIEAFF